MFNTCILLFIRQNTKYYILYPQVTDRYNKMIEKDNGIQENAFKNISKNDNGYGFLYIDKFKKKYIKMLIMTYKWTKSIYLIQYLVIMLLSFVIINNIQSIIGALKRNLNMNSEDYKNILLYNNAINKYKTAIKTFI